MIFYESVSQIVGTAGQRCFIACFEETRCRKLLVCRLYNTEIRFYLRLTQRLEKECELPKQIGETFQEASPVKISAMFISCSKTAYVLLASSRVPSNNEVAMAKNSHFVRPVKDRDTLLSLQGTLHDICVGEVRYKGLRDVAILPEAHM